MPWLHHLFIHFPVAISALALGVALLALIRPATSTRQWVRGLVYITLLGAVLAVTTGLLSTEHFVMDGGDGLQVHAHRNSALLALALVSVTAVVAWLTRLSPSRISDAGLAILLLLTATAAGMTAHRGGAMLHEGLGPPWGDAGSKHHHHHGAEPHADTGAIPAPDATLPVLSTSATDHRHSSDDHDFH